MWWDEKRKYPMRGRGRTSKRDEGKLVLLPAVPRSQLGDKLAPAAFGRRLGEVDGCCPEEEWGANLQV